MMPGYLSRAIIPHTHYFVNFGDHKFLRNRREAELMLAAAHVQKAMVFDII